MVMNGNPGDEEKGHCQTALVVRNSGRTDPPPSGVPRLPAFPPSAQVRSRPLPLTPPPGVYGIQGRREGGRGEGMATRGRPAAQPRRRAGGGARRPSCCTGTASASARSAPRSAAPAARRTCGGGRRKGTTGERRGTGHLAPPPPIITRLSEDWINSIMLIFLIYHFFNFYSLQQSWFFRFLTFTVFSLSPFSTRAFGHFRSDPIFPRFFGSSDKVEILIYEPPPLLPPSSNLPTTPAHNTKKPARHEVWIPWTLDFFLCATLLPPCPPPPDKKNTERPLSEI